jgi:hypothetical protein
MGIEVDLPVNIKEAVTLEILTTLVEELRSQSVNLRTRKRLNAIPLATMTVDTEFMDCVDSFRTFFGGRAPSCLSYSELYYRIPLLGWRFKAWIAAL